jgi:predicted dehydrogenase
MSLSRRTFLQAGAIAALPASVYRNAFCAEESPSERVRTAMIGVGNQGGPSNNLKYFNKNVVAVCDVDRTYLARAEEFVQKNQGQKPAAYGDFRKVLDAKDVDAVVITVPDQWHAYMTIEACKAGKHVYCEKPLTLVIDEGPKMIAAARKHNRVVQTGSMQRSGLEFIEAVKLVKGGAVGKVSEVVVTLPAPNWVAPRVKDAPPNAPVADSPPPPELDYDLWLGPAPQRPYNKMRLHYYFRFYWDYSGGQQTNFGAHHLDIAQWGLGMDESGPVSIEGSAVYHPEKWYETPDSAEVKYTYANGVVVTSKLGKDHGPAKQGTKFIGDKGTLFVYRGGIAMTPKDLVKGFELPKIAGAQANTSHVQNFYDCIKSGKKPNADVAIGHRSATVCHLGNIAVRTGRKIVWDPVKETIVGDADTAKWLSKEYRKPWALN